MPDWRRIVIGDVFELPSHDFNYYRDLFLFWPFFLTAIVGVTTLFGTKHEYRLSGECLGLAAICLFAARERVMLVGVSLGYMCVQGLIYFLVKRDWSAFAICFLSGVAFLLLVRSAKGYKLSYRIAKGGGTHIVSILVGLSSFLLTLGVFHYWLTR